ncbi:MAG: hypothetical protein PWP65_570 [Clostridia bacterium]|nr:hypothetical protein [Clostridia bacterium]
MIISTTTVLASRCPACGHLVFHGLNLFSFSGGGVQKLECSCGTTLVSINTKNCKNFCLQYRCIMCDAYHSVALTRRELWSPELLLLNCSETGLEVGFIGPQGKVQKAVRRHNRSLAEAAEDLGLTHYLEDPEIMCAALECVYHIAESGNLRCKCGNKDIEIEIFPGHLQLRCNSCGALATLRAATKKDLFAIQKLWEIILTPPIAEDKPRRSRRRTKKN